MAARKVHDPIHHVRTMRGLLAPFGTEQREKMLRDLADCHKQLSMQDRAMAGNKPKIKGVERRVR